VRAPSLCRDWSLAPLLPSPSPARRRVAQLSAGDGFWLARWLRASNIEGYVIHPTSIAVSREHRRAKTDRLDMLPATLAARGRHPPHPANCPLTAPILRGATAVRARRGAV